jgi:hypothetical protein
MKTSGPELKRVRRNLYITDLHNLHSSVNTIGLSDEGRLKRAGYVACTGRPRNSHKKFNHGNNHLGYPRLVGTIILKRY